MEGLNRLLLLHREWTGRPVDWGARELSRDERRRAQGMRHGERREQFLAGRWALRQLLSSRGGRPQDWAITAEGRPQAEHRRGWLAPKISLAHSGPWVLAGLSNAGPLGLDLERLGQKRPWKELAAFHGLKRPQQKTELGFLHFWTRHEAQLKMAPATPDKIWRLRSTGFVAAVFTQGPQTPILKCFGPALGTPVLTLET